MDIEHSELVTSAHERAVIEVVITYNTLLERTLNALRPYSLSDQHYNILKVLEARSLEAVSVGELKEKLFNKRGDLTRLLDKLSALKLVDRDLNPDNRRQVDVRITHLGLSQLAQMDMALRAGRDSRIEAALSPLEATTLIELLTRLRN